VSLPLGIAIILVADAIAIGALLFVRRGAPEGSYFADGDRASGVFGVLATGFAIFAGFVIFLAFTTYDDTRSGAEAEASAAQVRLNIQRASNYVLGVVLFAVALFFAGMSTKLGAPRLRVITLSLGCALFLGTTIWIATFPVSVAV
jgi:hypothetical protein